MSETLEGIGLIIIGVVLVAIAFQMRKDET